MVRHFYLHLPRRGGKSLHRSKTTDEQFKVTAKVWGVTEEYVQSAPDADAAQLQVELRIQKGRGKNASYNIIRVEPLRKTQDIGKSNPELLKLVKDPGANERDVGAAIQLLTARGINPKTGLHVGVAAATKVGREMGDLASS